MTIASHLSNASRLLGKDYDADAGKFLQNAVATRTEIAKLLSRETDIRMLDVGCGESYPATVLFTIWGWQVTGIDVDPAWRCSPIRALRVAAKSGLKGIVKKVFHEFCVVRRYQSALLRLAGAEMPRNLDIRLASVTDLPFPDGQFDVVYSHAVLEHIPDLERGTAEMARVMKPGAIGRHLIHLFTSISGGHDPRWENPEELVPSDVPPWDHLLTGRSPSIDYLNCLRERHYRACLEQHFEILEWRKRREGASLLTPELREALKEYDEEELLTRGIEAIVRKPL